MSIFLDEVTDQLNLRWAWEKVRREATPGDIWFDEVELAGFEMELGQNLQSIARDFMSGTYRLAKLRPLPFPKHNDDDGNSRVRQVFQVALRDQVAWTAIVNVIGPHVDSQMPSWSYGNRLYRTIWVEEDDKGRKQRKIGRYRHAAGRLYLPFGQSWPIFRRHVYLATCAMTATNKALKLDERSVEELEIQEQLQDEQRCPFTVPKYWRGRRPRNKEQVLYWCSLDLEKFYPSMKLQIVIGNILEKLPNEWRDDASQLLNLMTQFQLNLSEWTANDLKNMDIDPDSQAFPHIPTGLYVAGFLANAGLLRIDKQVTKQLATRNIAHFRFVDDHIVLAYSFDALETWVREYMALLDEAQTGAKINPKKIEPKELADLFFAKNSHGEREGKKIEDAREHAEEKCRLDPQFPSPLMTKTLALVSGIARTNFNMLEPGELAALTDQLEHLLLVHLPEEEIPERTRLSFAATRLTRVAECRLANDDSLAVSNHKKQACLAQLTKKGLTKEGRQQLKRELKDLEKNLNDGIKHRKDEVDRAFQLLRKVLRERPDRVRLWTRAVLMCRLTGVKGLADLVRDISKVRETNPLAAEYLRANTLVLLGRQSLIAARILSNEDMPDWRREAAKAFLEDVSAVRLKAPTEENDRWFLCASWRQYCFGIYCADLALQDGRALNDEPHGVSFFKAILGAGRKCLEADTLGHKSPQWAWWAGSMTLRDLAPHAGGFVKVLGKALKPSRETSAFWTFFPMDAPTPVLRDMARENYQPGDSETLGGWWYDALRDRPAEMSSLPDQLQRSEISQAVKALSRKQNNTVSLYDWCHFLLQHGRGTTDPRTGEWTALEIVRQIAALLDENPIHVYLKTARVRQGHLPWVHPANFTIPRLWMEGEEPTWSRWQEDVKKSGEEGGVAYVPISNRIMDRRYTPLLSTANPLFRSVNPVHGLGILLYGLLRKNFDLPALWNGSGHADVLGMLPKLLLGDMTCSSWTLGVLQGCLQPRATENLFMRAHPWSEGPDNDTLADPIAFLSASQVAHAIQKCQEVLEENQLSTLDHKARQLTPISIQQMTSPEWNKA